MCYVFVIGNVIFLENTLVLQEELYSKAVSGPQPHHGTLMQYGKSCKTSNK